MRRKLKKNGNYISKLKENIFYFALYIQKNSNNQFNIGNKKIDIYLRMFTALKISIK